jgi:hypothetical protein
MLSTPTEGRDCPGDLIPGVARNQRFLAANQNAKRSGDVLTLKPKMGRELNPFAVVVPEYRVRCNRTTGASLLVAPTVSDLCKGSSELLSELGDNMPSRTGFLSSLLTPFVEEGGSTLPIIESGPVGFRYGF